MSDLEHQCEDIRLLCGSERLSRYASWAEIDTLLAYIAELRRPSDAKEIAEIQRIHEVSAPYHFENPNAWKDYNKARLERGKLLHALAESQRECARLQQWTREWHTALQAAAVVVEADSNGSPSEVAQSIRARFDQLQAEIARLQSPPEERRDIVERRAGRLKCYLPVGEQMQADIDTLLQDCARYRNAHVILLGERDAAREKAERLLLKLNIRIRHLDRSRADERAKAIRIEQLEAALRETLRKWVELVESGDAGHWDPEKEPHVIAARAALAAADPKESAQYDGLCLCPPNHCANKWIAGLDNPSCRGHEHKEITNGPV